MQLGLKLTNSPQSHYCRCLTFPCPLHSGTSQAADFTLAGIKRVCPVSTQDKAVPTHSLIEKTTLCQRMVQLCLGKSILSQVTLWDWGSSTSDNQRDWATGKLLPPESPSFLACNRGIHFPASEGS